MLLKLNINAGKIMNNGTNIQNIEVKTKEFDLCVIFDQTLKFVWHISAINNKANIIVGVIR